MEMVQPSETKRQRESEGLAPTESGTKRTKNESTSLMDSKELASAVALASLASFSPSTQKLTTKPLADPARRKEAATSTATLETRSPSSEPIPVSPDVRSPMRTIKRVHFASNVKQKMANDDPGRHVEFQPPGNLSARPFPVRLHQNGFVFPAMGRPHGQQPHWMPAAPTRMLSQRLMQQPFGASNLHWICDFCNAAAFNTYEEACLHEESCKHQVRRNPAPSPRLPSGVNAGGLLGAGNARQGEGETGLIFSGAPVSSTEYFCGSISLSLPESDAEWLSEINCFVRRYCVEAFSATEEDVMSTSKRGRISLHQVGIRCCHCKHRPLKERAVAAVSYPTSVAGIYESVKRFHRVHVEHCDCIPEDVRTKMAELHNLNVWIPTTRQYWTDSARALGMVDTEEGIRFSCDPRFIREAKRPSQVGETSAAGGVCNTKQVGKLLADGDYIVLAEDMRIVPAYVYFLMRQVESCHFSEVDRFVARSKGPVGYPGFQCRHCSGHAGLGKYFPVSAKTLSTNSTSQNIHAHLLKCRKCPDSVKEKLVALKVEKSRSPRLEPGWRKIFFDKVWHRLHG